jgi:hypothetical protein
MRAARDHSIAYQTAPFGSPLSDTWKQAGIFSFAYRLAHLSMPRLGALTLVSAFFYFV